MDRGLVIAEQGQNWEPLVATVDDRYARSGGLAELLDELDQQYDAAAAIELRRVSTLDVMVKTTMKDAYYATESVFERALIGGLAVAVWNGVRRSSGFGEMAVSTAQAPDGSRPPFRSLAAAWAFAEESRGIGIGWGPLSSVVAETSDRALAAGRAAAIRGRDRDGAGGFLPTEWMASSPTHVGGASSKNEARVILRNDILVALDRSVEDADVPLLALVVLGERRRIPAARMVGDVCGTGKRPLQFELVRLTMREAARWARERGDADSEEAIRKRIGRARDAFRRALEARKLIPIEPTRAPRPNRVPPDRFEILDAAERMAGR